MQLPKSVKSLDAVPEAYRSLYSEKDGGYSLTIEIAGTVDQAAIEGLIANRDEILEEKKKLAKKYEGIDLERYQQLVSEEESRKTKKIKDEKDWESREAQIHETYKKTIEPMKGKLSAVSGQLQKVLVRDALERALLEAGAKITGGVNLIVPLAQEKVKVRERDDGTLEAYVVDDNGKERFSFKDGTTQKFSFSELAAELKEMEEFQGCFAPKGTSGGGAPGSDRTHGGAMIVTQADMADPAKYLQIKEQALKAGVPLEKIQVIK